MTKESPEPQLLCRRRKPSAFLGACYEMAEVLASAVLAIAVLFSFALRFAGVVGASMQPTLNNRDWLAITAYPHEPQRGDIVIISPRTNRFNEPLVKRVVATAGDIFDIQDGRALVNGAEIDEPYLDEGLRTEPMPPHLSDLEYPVVVPRNMVFVLGDNREGSTDSRCGDVGFIRVDDILGRVLFRVYASGSDRRFSFKVE